MTCPILNCSSPFAVGLQCGNKFTSEETVKILVGSLLHCAITLLTLFISTCPDLCYCHTNQLFVISQFIYTPDKVITTSLNTIFCSIDREIDTIWCSKLPGTMCTQISENQQHEPGQTVLFYHKKIEKPTTLHEALRALSIVIDYLMKWNDQDCGILILLGQMQERLEQRDQQERDYLDICKQTGLHQNLQWSICWL